MRLPELLRELGDGLGLGEVAVDEGDGATLVVDDTFEITIEPGPEGRGIVIVASVGVVPKDDALPVCRTLLEANVGGLDTGGAALGLDPDDGTVMLSRAILTDEMPFAVFDRELTVFMTALRDWTTRLKTGVLTAEADGPSPQEAGDANPPHGGLRV